MRYLLLHGGMLWTCNTITLRTDAAFHHTSEYGPPSLNSDSGGGDAFQLQLPTQRSVIPGYEV